MGDGGEGKGQGARAPTKKLKIFFLGGGNYHLNSGIFRVKYHVKFGHFANFSYIYFPAKTAPQ